MVAWTLVNGELTSRTGAFGGATNAGATPGRRSELLLLLMNIEGYLPCSLVEFTSQLGAMSSCIIRTMCLIAIVPTL